MLGVWLAGDNFFQVETSAFFHERILEAQERLEKAKEREKLLISGGCVETGRDPITNNELWNCPEGANIPPLGE
jgi:hypothetical protein